MVRTFAERNKNKKGGAKDSSSASSARQVSPEDQASLSLVTSRYELARGNQYPFFSDFDRYYKLYESYVADNLEIYQSKIFIPMVFSVIERYLPRIIGNKPTVNFMARRPDTVDKAANMQALFEWQWDQVSRIRDGGMYLELLRFVKDALIVGTAVAKVPWRSESRETKKYNKDNEVEQRIVKYFEGPDFQLIDPYDFFYDPEAVDIQRASWVIHRTRRTLEEMREINQAKGAEIYKNLDELEEIKGVTDKSLSDGEQDFKFRRKTALGGAQVLIQDTTTPKHELMECWGLFPKFDKQGKPTDDQSLDWRVVTVADRKIVVRNIPYPYWHGKKPFIAYSPWPRSYDFYGVPIIKHLERIQWTTNEFINQKFDNQVISLNSMLVVDPSANVEDWQLTWRPGGIIRAHPEYIKPLQIGDATPNIDQSLSYLSSVSQLTTGLSDYYTAGTDPQTTEQKTATGANIIEEQIAARLKEAVQVMEEVVIKEIGYQWHGLDGQFVKLPKIIRVIGPTGKPEFPLIMPEDCRYEYDVIPEQGSIEPINKSLLRQQFIQALQMVTSNQFMAQLTDWHTVEMELWKQFGQKQPEKLMTSTPGSQPGSIPGAQQPGMPGGSPGMQAPNNVPQMMAQNMNGQMPMQQRPNPGRPNMQPQQPPGIPQQGASGGQPGMQPPPPPLGIKPHFEDLTLSEQRQVLERAGLQPDMKSRIERFAKEQDQQKTDRALDMIERFKTTHPLGGEPTK